eukprot:g4809.t1 g4809   contig17:93488-94420(+)
MAMQQQQCLRSKCTIVGVILIVVVIDIINNSRRIQVITSTNYVNIISVTNNNDFNGESCFRARNDTIPKNLYGKLQTPYINLGFAKIGTSSIHSFFGCAGYRSTHYRCSVTTSCAECIRQSVEEGLPPLHYCVMADVYSQIDDGSHGHYPQIEYLKEFVNGYPNATFLLPFRSMEKWYKSMQNWHNQEKGMDEHLMMANISGLPVGIGRNIEEFSTWWCWHVNRVRELVAQSPSHALVEINLEDASLSERMSDVFDIDESCWGHVNANHELHTDLNNDTETTTGETMGWFVVGKKMIRGKNGTRRKINKP